ncbi:hypothetical protein [Ornithinimicrobium kibberense]|uniref:hypothetical protein n=1 Tax=Ornithinimicrobium kibberense TaxID=282060 RepID=UPI0036065DE0
MGSARWSSTTLRMKMAPVASTKPAPAHRAVAGSGDRALSTVLTLSGRQAWRNALSPAVKPMAVTRSHRTATGPAMYSNGEMPSSRVRPPMTRPTRPSQRGTAWVRAATNRLAPVRPARVHSHGMVPVQWL